MASKFQWYWRRLRAMSAGELAGRVRVKWRQRKDRKGPPDFSNVSLAGFFYPRVPEPEKAPLELREALARDTRDILAGRWKFFGHLPLQVDRPPKWQFDYLVGRDFQSEASGFDLEHRAQPDGADIKLIWEPSRWQQLVRLAMAACVLRDAVAGAACVEWLRDWVEKNPAYTGLNWTSPLETGIRLIQFAWIDALLGKAGFEGARLEELRRAILPAHVWYTWRYLSFGSSANNHLLGEVAGLAVAVARYPGLARVGTDLRMLGEIYEREILRQFAEDGGNREQALSYHLFSYELCAQTEAALAVGGVLVSKAARERLRAAGRFYAAVKLPDDPWEYGDSDNAAVVPLELEAANHAAEFRAYFAEPASSPALQFWLGSEGVGDSVRKGWAVFHASGYAVFHGAKWQARVDASELGYLATAAHGHLDALHLSLWKDRAPVVIDPGTGAYYADKKLREHFSSWGAHNGPHLSGALNFPERFGTFLWGKPHARPILTANNETVSAEVELHGCMLRRHVRLHENVWEVRDETKLLTGEADPAALGELRVHWHFAPGTRLEKVEELKFRLSTPGGDVMIELENWKVVKWANPQDAQNAKTQDIDLVCSPAFRTVMYGPILHLQEALDAVEVSITRFRAENDTGG